MNSVRTSRGRVCLGIALAGLLVGLGGCGYSDHDEFFRIRSIVVQPTVGDGSEIASLPRQTDLPAAMVANRPRGQVSDQPLWRD